MIRRGDTKPSRSLRYAAASALALSAGGAAEAQLLDGLITTIDVRAGYTRNPFLLSGDAAEGSGYAEFVISPAYTYAGEYGTWNLSARYNRTEYFERYDGTNSYSGTAQYLRQLDERTSMNAYMTYDSSILGEQDLFGAFLPIDPTTPLDPITGLPIPDVPGAPIVPVVPGDIGDIDVGLIGTGQRRNFFATGLGLTHRPGVNDSISVSGGATRASYPDSDFLLGGQDYSSYDASIGYQRTISSRSTVGVQGLVSYTDYDGPFSFDSTVYQPQVTYSHRFNERYSINVALGALIIEQEGGLPSSTSLSGSLNGCRVSPRSSLCVSAARSASPTGLGSTREQTSVSVGYNYRLNEDDNISLSAGHTRLSSAGVLDPERDYTNANASWSRSLTERLSGGVSLSYRDASDPFRSIRPDFNGQVFLTVRLGR